MNIVWLILAVVCFMWAIKCHFESAWFTVAMLLTAGFCLASISASVGVSKANAAQSQQTRQALVDQMDKTGEWEEVFRDETKTIMRQGQMTIVISSEYGPKPDVEIRFLSPETKAEEAKTP